MDRTQLVLGGPGTGKTTFLIKKVEEALRMGTDPKRIAFVSFTKAAAQEAATRASTQLGLSPSDMPYFVTVHALCFRELGMNRSMVLDRADWSVISNLVGLEITGRASSPEDVPGGGARDGDRCLSLISYSKATRKDLKEVWKDYGEDLDWFRLKQLHDTLQEYKSDNNKIDFDDMLSLFIRKRIEVDVDLVIVDEGQDLTANQWSVVRTAFARTPTIMIGGDDDQAIYEWSGADVKTFLGLSNSPHVLSVSHRLPKPVWELAESISSRISRRYSKSWKSATHDGSIVRAASLDYVNDELDGSFMYIARNNYLLHDVCEKLRYQGVLYATRRHRSVDPRHVRAIVAWEKRRRGVQGVSTEDLDLADSFAGRQIPHDVVWFNAMTGIDGDTRNYYRAALRRGSKLTDEPQVLVDTIHGVKGKEADNVVLLTDVSRRTQDGFDINPNAEHRVFYVGATRAKRTLTIVEPRTEFHYPI